MRLSPNTPRSDQLQRSLARVHFIKIVREEDEDERSEGDVGAGDFTEDVGSLNQSFKNRLKPIRKASSRALPSWCSR
jgi:hypothetical protein